VQSQMVWPWEPIASMESREILCDLVKEWTADAKVSPRMTFISESSSGVVVLWRIMVMMRLLMTGSRAISPYFRSENCIGEEGVSWEKWQSAQSMPSWWDVREFHT